MNNFLPAIDPQQETQKITTFLSHTLEEQHIKNTVIGLSGGIDSAVSFHLLKEVFEPQHIFAAHLYYNEPALSHIENFLTGSGIPETNILVLSIKKPVDELVQLLDIQDDESGKKRKGNIAARIRMITLFDLAKKHTALVCGTENKSENLLGYFTRFGDQASDIEPIEHLYKTQIYTLAEYLKVPQVVLDQKPTAGLWEGQTDEGEFGFTYEEADQVLYLHIEKNLSIEEIKSKGLKNAAEILKRRQNNLFKHKTPYLLSDEK